MAGMLAALPVLARHRILLNRIEWQGAGYTSKGVFGPCSARPQSNPLWVMSALLWMQPQGDTHHTAWSSMSTLVHKGLVSKQGCPAK